MTKKDINVAIDYLVKERDYIQYECEQDNANAETVLSLTRVINALREKTGYDPKSSFYHELEHVGHGTRNGQQILA